MALNTAAIINLNDNYNIHYNYTLNIGLQTVHTSIASSSQNLLVTSKFTRSISNRQPLRNKVSRVAATNQTTQRSVVAEILWMVAAQPFYRGIHWSR